jgi:hypothetical protein
VPAGWLPADHARHCGDDALGARLFCANVSFDDQPFERRMAGRIIP